MNIANNLARWFSGLQPRERLIIKLGAGLLAVAAIYMALLPAMQKNTDLEQRYKRLNEDMQWLREQSQVVDRLGSNCAGQTMQSGKKKDVITRIVRRNQLKLLGLQQGDTSSYSLSVSGPSPNRLLQLVYQLSCQGLRLNALDVRSSAGAKETYAADLEVSYVE